MVRARESRCNSQLRVRADEYTVQRSTSRHLEGWIESLLFIGPTWWLRRLGHLGESARSSPFLLPVPIRCQTSSPAIRRCVCWQRTYWDRGRLARIERRRRERWCRITLTRTDREQSVPPAVAGGSQRIASGTNLSTALFFASSVAACSAQSYECRYGLRLQQGKRVRSCICHACRGSCQRMMIKLIWLRVGNAVTYA